MLQEKLELQINPERKKAKSKSFPIKCYDQSGKGAFYFYSGFLSIVWTSNNNTNFDNRASYPGLVALT